MRSVENCSYTRKRPMKVSTTASRSAHSVLAVDALDADACRSTEVPKGRPPSPDDVGTAWCSDESVSLPWTPLLLAHGYRAKGNERVGRAICIQMKHIMCRRQPSVRGSLTRGVIIVFNK